MQPSLVLTQTVPLNIIFPLCVIRTFAFDFAPSNVPKADGRPLFISSNTAIFSIIGTIYGGNGVSYFTLPNLQGIAIISMGQGNDLSFYNIGDQIGSQQVILIMNQMPAHAHSIPNSFDFTGVTGGLQPFSNIQPSLSMNYLICIAGIFPSRDSTISQLPFIGQIVPYTGSTIPNGWALAAGTLLPIQTNTALFSIIGTTYGGDGRSTFRLPDLRGRVAVGVAPGSNTQLGGTNGAEFVTLTDNNLPSHQHSLAGSKYNASETDAKGAGQPLDNRQPFLGITYLISLAGIFPSHDGGSVDPQTAYLGEIFTFAGNYAPQSCAFADGRLLSISQNQALFALIGTMYGGNGQTTFALPDLRDRVPIGSGGGFSVGQQLGSSTVTLTTDQIPAHTHSLNP
ncbi:unnamed protein product [Rotaria sp. Silwood2]|nr:unnamed protein product [Rotaria sp. Silwood2]CAF4105544.1 unnamed protein product [Rotaria sp. Silwood2]